ncbi:hypothetical protein HPB52_024136 [Rhipicephalus sanguineus]|uniref:BPTI/Kunitz inhibitor domain-containing protein n=1 Tax=Rhipicephalus sanguineus TaxID=34632 RepID=A0A9D4QCT1_RHISA|nr:hypothetical protein HPB52_024136 [Rhipicephalus sanguineus]
MKACVLLALLGTAYAAATMSPLCELELDKGECGRSQQKWGFNKSTGKCELFSYSGCGGNDNRFDDKQACELACIAAATLSPLCELELDKGECGRSQQKWGFNNSTGKCELFSYSGCGGNDNRFDEKYACERACIDAQVIDVVFVGMMHKSYGDRLGFLQ